MLLPPRPRHRRILIATALVAVGVPVGAAAWVDARTDELAAHLGEAGGVPVRIGGVDADLTGAIRLTEVAFGDLITADAIEASVALESLLSGQLRADEIRVASPRVAVHVGADGDSDLSRLVHRLAKQGARSTGTRGRLRRIVVSSGTLTADIAGIGQIAADGVELVPDADGVRVITGPVRVRTSGAPVDVELSFARSAAELTLPRMQFHRVLAVGGTGSVTTGDRALVLRDVAAGRLALGGTLEVTASVDDGGISRPLALELSPLDLSVTVRGEQIPLRALSALAPHGIVVDGAHASGSLHIQRQGSSIAIEGDGSFEGLSVDHRSLATMPVPVAAKVRGRLTIAPEAIAVPELAIDSGAIHARVSGWLRRGAPVSGQLEAQLAPARCNDLLASLPAEIRGPLDGMVLDGTLGGRARLAIDLAAPLGDGTELMTSLDGGCKTLAEPPAADVTTLTGNVPHQFPDGSQATVGPDQESWIQLRRIPWRVQGAFVSAEDGRFWEHAGFDIQQIARSLEIDLRERRLARGGSTISQQLIKNAFLTHRRTLDRKLQEAVLTWRLEAKLDKKQILERYLNIVELGPRMFGIGPAARYWFDSSPRSLTVRQGAFLAAMTSEPTSMSRRVRKHGGLDPQSAERVATILRAMRRDGVIDDADFELARGDAMHFTSASIRGDR